MYIFYSMHFLAAPLSQYYFFLQVKIEVVVLCQIALAVSSLAFSFSTDSSLDLDLDFDWDLNHSILASSWQWTSTPPKSQEIDNGRSSDGCCVPVNYVVTRSNGCLLVSISCFLFLPFCFTSNSFYYNTNVF